MSSPSLPVIPSTGETFGACYVGSVLAAILFGISNIQAAIYYKRYPDDWWVYRYSVALLWVLDTLHVALSIHAIYFYLVIMFGDLIGGLESNLWSMKLQLCLNNFLVVLVQWLYAIRLWKLGRHFHKILPWLAFLAVVTSLGTTIYLIYGICIMPNLLSVSIIKKPIYVFFATIVAADFIIALLMCYYLHKSRKDTVFSITATVILRLMRFILISGLATSVCSLFVFIAYNVWPESLIFVGIHFVLSKSYINSLLAMLNSRSVPWTNRATEHEVNLCPAVLHIAHHGSDGDTSKMNTSIPLQHVSSFNDKSDHSKEVLNCQV